MAGTYSIDGAISGLRTGTDRAGRPYATFRFAFTTARGAHDRWVTVQGEALARLADLRDGKARLLLRMDGGAIEVLGRPVRGIVDARQAAMAL